MDNNMIKWLFTRLVDILIVFLLVTLLLWYGASRYPQFFPSQFFSYWQVAKPHTAVLNPAPTP